MLGAWKGVPYAKRFRRSYNLEKVEDENHLLFVYPNTQKVRKRFCSTLPLTHTSTLVKLMQTTNTIILTKFIACCEYQKTVCSPQSTFSLMDSLVPNEHKIVNSKQLQKDWKTNAFVHKCTSHNVFHDNYVWATTRHSHIILG